MSWQDESVSIVHWPAAYLSQKKPTYQDMRKGQVIQGHPELLRDTVANRQTIAARIGRNRDVGVYRYSDILTLKGKAQPLYKVTRDDYERYLKEADEEDARTNNMGRRRNNPCEEDEIAEVIEDLIDTYGADAVSEVADTVLATDEVSELDIDDDEDEADDPELLDNPARGSMTYGQLPTKQEFLDAFDEEVPHGRYHIRLSRSDADALDDTSLGNGSYTAEELWKGLQEIVNSGNEQAMDIASSIMETLGFEWI